MIASGLAFLGGVAVQELLLILLMILWVWALIDCATGTFSKSSSKVIWIIVIILFSFLGSILYFVAGRSGRIRKR